MSVREHVCVCEVMRDPHHKRIIWFQVLNEFRVFSLSFYISLASKKNNFFHFDFIITYYNAIKYNKIK